MGDREKAEQKVFAVLVAGRFRERLRGPMLPCEIVLNRVVASAFSAMALTARTLVGLGLGSLRLPRVEASTSEQQSAFLAFFGGFQRATEHRVMYE